MIRFLKVSAFLWVIVFGLMLSGLSTSVFAQSGCVAPSYVKTTTSGKINWEQFPSFSLPFKVIYNGPRLGDSLQSPLKHGFSHLATFTQYDSQLARDKRALIWYGVASIAGQPWYEIESPWNNDLTLYKQNGQVICRVLQRCLQIQRVKKIQTLICLSWILNESCQLMLRLDY